MMTQFSKLEDLKRALTKVPIFSTGVKSFPHMVKTYIERHAFKNGQVPQIFGEVMEPFLERAYQHVVSLDQQLCRYFDEKPPFQLEEALLSGSWSEGLFLFYPKQLEPPDVDFMCILKNISFSEADQLCGNLSLKENCPFVNVYLSDINLLRMWQSYLVEETSDALEGKICQISSKKLKEHLHKNYLKADSFFPVAHEEQCEPVTDSPSLKLSRAVPKSLFNDHRPFPKFLLQSIVFHIWRNSDLVLAIRCDGWPHNALEWIYRQRYWPPKDVVERIQKQGFHIVPKSSREGNFRLSFSCAEGILIENLNKLQHKVMRAFKAIIKFLVPCNADNKEILCSYHLKTIGFWHFEKSAQDTWTEDNIVNHLFQMLEDLIEALRNGNLPMYFLRGYNLLGNVENYEEMKKLSDRVKGISRDIPKLEKAVKRSANFRLHKQDYRVLLDIIKII